MLTIRMPNHASDLGLPDSSDLTVQTLAQVKAASPELPPPAEVADAELPVRRTSER